MAFSDFLATIKSPELHAVAIHWNDARGTRPMPGWRDIDPAVIAPYLPIIWSWKYDKKTNTFTGRLAGEVIVNAHGENLHGKRMQDFFTGPQYPGIFYNYLQVVTRPAFAHETGQVFRHMSRYGVGERIIMPLADDGQNGDGILGATTYSMDQSAPEDKLSDADQIEFFALD